MPTTREPARPGLVLPEYGPGAAELLRRRFGRRGLRVAGAAVALLAVAVGLALLAGDGLTSFEHRSAPVFTILHPADTVRRVAPAPGEIVRLRSRRGRLEGTVTVRPIRLPAYRGSVSGLLPLYIERHERALAAELPGFRVRQDGKARVNDAPGYQLRYRAGPPERRLTGIDIFLVAKDGQRDGVLLRYRQTNPARALDEAGRDLVKATRKAFRSFRFGLDRP